MYNNIFLDRSFFERIRCSDFEHYEKKEDYFKILRYLQKIPNTSQRELAENLGFSLGKLNYCLKELKKKGLVKIKNFQKKKIKLNIYNIQSLQKVFQKELN